MDKSWLLYQVSDRLSAAISAAQDVAEQAQGEIPESLDAEIEALGMERDALILDVARAVKNLEAEAELLKAEKMRLATRQSRADGIADRLRCLINRCGMLKPGEKISDGVTAVSMRKAPPSVDIISANAIPREYIKIEESIKRKEILADLKAGKEVPGAAISAEHYNLSIK